MTRKKRHLMTQGRLLENAEAEKEKCINKTYTQVELSVEKTDC